MPSSHSRDQSIHPPVRLCGEKKNTSKPHKGGGKLAKRQVNLNRRRLAHSDLLKGRSINPAAFRTPGSMNGHKR